MQTQQKLKFGRQTLHQNKKDRLDLVTLLLLCLSLSLLVSTEAGAQLPGPVIVSQKRLAIRSNLEDLIKTQNHDHAPGFPYQYFRVEDAHVGFFPDVARFIAHAGNGKPLKRENRIEGCQKHQAALKAVAQSKVCSASAALIELLERSFVSCQRVHQAESYGQEFQPAVISRETQTTLAGLIGISSRIYLDMPWPESLWGKAEMSQWREIIIKVRAEDLKDSLRNSETALSSLKSQISRSTNPSDCSILGSESILQLQNELQASVQKIEILSLQGLEQGQREQRKLQSSGRYRAELPFPTLTNQERRFLGFWLGALNWRNRGGGPIKLDGTQAARLNFASRPFQELGRLAGGEFGERVGGTFMFPLILVGWGEWMDMGLSGGEPYEDLIRMTDRGLYQVRHTSQSLKPAGYDIETLRGAGMQMGACYWYASRKLPNVLFHQDAKPPYVGFVDSFTAWGELCSGGALGLALVDTLLQGSNYPHH